MNLQFAPVLANSSKYLVANQPLVTALINTHNYARYLPLAINSVLTQTYPKIEIVVVDDGSTDHTAEVLAQYGDRVRAIRTENGGQGHAFNVGIGNANGELIMLLDADDTWMQEKVQLMVDLAAKFPKAAMLYHRFQNIDRDGGYNGPPQPIGLRSGNFRHTFLRSGGSWEHPIASVLTLRTEHIRRALPLPTYAVREGADAIISDYCVLTSEIASLPDALTLRRVHGSNLYATGREGFFDRSKATREGDVRRVEWRIFSLQKLMQRLGDTVEFDLDRNEWRLINMFILGRASFWRLVKALRAPKLGRLRAVLVAKRRESGPPN